MDVTISAFDDLTPRDVHDALLLRSAVFVVEQNCVFCDPDADDFRSTHVLIRVPADPTDATDPTEATEAGGRLIGYARWFTDPDGSIRIGRVVTATDRRSEGLGHELMRICVDAIPAGTTATVHAQAHLEAFYASHGFVTIGDPFDEDGIPHLRMVRPGADPATSR